MCRRFFKSVPFIVASLIFSISQLTAADVINVNSVTGKWNNAETSSGNTPTDFSGGGTNAIHWGNATTQNGNSGYSFVGNAPPIFNVSLNTPFAIGTFSHINFPVTGNSLAEVDLSVQMSLNINGSATNFSGTYHFLHDETPNTGGNGCCDDHVTIQNNVSQLGVFNINGVNYTIALLGFKTSVDGPLLTQFDTLENQTNSATLFASIVSQSVVAPEPSTYLVMAGFLTVCGFVSYRRKAKQPLK